MLNDILAAMQNPQADYIEALTEVNGCYCDIYNRHQLTEYDSARGVQGDNEFAFDEDPTYKDEKLLVYMPVQQTYEGTGWGEQFDAYMREDTYLITHKEQLEIELYQKVVVYYGNSTRTFQIFKMESIDGIDGSIVRIVYLSPLT